jgi:hypothetical protein
VAAFWVAPLSFWLVKEDFSLERTICSQQGLAKKSAFT